MARERLIDMSKASDAANWHKGKYTASRLHTISALLKGIFIYRFRFVQRYVHSESWLAILHVNCSGCVRLNGTLFIPTAELISLSVKMKSIHAGIFMFEKTVRIIILDMISMLDCEYHEILFS